MRPTQNRLHQQTANAAAPVPRSRSQRDQLRSGSLEECAYDAASVIATHREEPGPSLAIHSFDPFEPFHVGKLRLPCIGRAKGMRSVFERRKAHRFEQQGVLLRDRFDLNQGEFPTPFYPVL